MDIDIDNKRCVYNKEGESIQWVPLPFRSQPGPSPLPMRGWHNPRSYKLTNHTSSWVFWQANES